MVNAQRPWLSWIAIGVGLLALLSFWLIRGRSSGGRGGRRTNAPEGS